MRKCLAILFTVLVGGPCAWATTPTPLPVGYDAYRQWDHWPMQRIGSRAYMRSTYDRAGGNETADASHFLYQEKPDFNVTLDLEGKGILYFLRTNHWHGSPWHFEVDHQDHTVSETSTADPLHPDPNSTFIPAELFPQPLAYTWATTKGADLSWLPIGFEQSFRIAYSRTHYGTGYYIYDQFADGTPLSQPINSYDFKTPPPKDVIDLLNAAGTDIAPPNLASQTTKVQLATGKSQTLFDLSGPAMIRALDISLPAHDALALSNARLRITWDGRKDPSVDAPLALFFGAGVFYNRDNREYLVKSLPSTIRYSGDTVHLACYFPMPFFKSAHIEIADAPPDLTAEISAQIRTEPFIGDPTSVGYFHATYRDHGSGELGQDLVFLNTHGIEGSEEWSGSFVGTSFIFTDRAALRTLEGDPRFFFDDSETPQAQGTGTEEWGGGGDYWGGDTMTLPLAGHPTGCVHAADAKAPQDLIHSAYRFLLADMFPFGKNARIQLEHGGRNESTEHYQSVTYWYGLPAASVVRTDLLKIGAAADEQSHGYNSPQASAPAQIESRYELGVDKLDENANIDRAYRGPTTHPVIVFPAHTETERHTQGTSEFTLKLDPSNRGIFLRRTLDYSLANQRAEVFIADATDNKTPTDADFQSAGAWYLAGSNRCVFSNPKGELDLAHPQVQTSNRRFRDDEFLVPLRLTQGRSAIRVRVKYSPVEHQLLPNRPLDPSGWSEIRYAAYCWITPRFSVDPSPSAKP